MGTLKISFIDNVVLTPIMYESNALDNPYIFYIGFSNCRI
jgi:hypothetical protein